MLHSYAICGIRERVGALLELLEVRARRLGSEEIYDNAARLLENGRSEFHQLTVAKRSSSADSSPNRGRYLVASVSMCRWSVSSSFEPALRLASGLST